MKFYPKKFKNQRRTKFKPNYYTVISGRQFTNLMSNATLAVCYIFHSKP